MPQGPEYEALREMKDEYVQGYTDPPTGGDPSLGGPDPREAFEQVRQAQAGRRVHNMFYDEPAYQADRDRDATVAAARQKLREIRQFLAELGEPDDDDPFPAPRQGMPYAATEAEQQQQWPEPGIVNYPWGPRVAPAAGGFMGYPWSDRDLEAHTEMADIPGYAPML